MSCTSSRSVTPGSDAVEQHRVEDRAEVRGFARAPDPLVVAPVLLVDGGEVAAEDADAVELRDHFRVQRRPVDAGAVLEREAQQPAGLQRRVQGHSARRQVEIVRRDDIEAADGQGEGHRDRPDHRITP